MRDDQRNVTRRQLLRGAAAVATVSALAPAIDGCGGTSSAAPTDAGAVAAFPAASFTAVGHFIVARDSGGLYAYSNVCPHEGCDVPVPTAAMPMSTCPCHATRFDANGNVQPGGLTSQNLPHYSVAINAGHVMVDTSVVLTDRGARTVVPA